MTMGSLAEELNIRLRFLVVVHVFSMAESHSMVHNVCPEK